MIKKSVARAVSSEDLAKEVAEAERNFEELMTYHSEVLRNSREGRRGARLKWACKNLMLRRQVERHILYWRLQREIARDAYDELLKMEQKSAS